MTGERILVVDDQTHIVRILKRALMRDGYLVDTAINGEQAWELAENTVYTAVLTDYQMPKIDGRTLCELIRNQDPDGRTLLVLMTAIADQSLGDWAAGLVNTIYLEKPVSLKRLMDMLADYIEEQYQNNGVEQAQ